MGHWSRLGLAKIAYNLEYRHETLRNRRAPWETTLGSFSKPGRQNNGIARTF